MLAFRDKATLLDHVSRALPVGGRFAFTVEEGRPLTEAERAQMPAADTVWLIPLERAARSARACRSGRPLAGGLERVASLDGRLAGRAYAAEGLEDLVTSHRLWSEWLASGRVRKFALVAERRSEAPRQP